jgi:hypothetical protein
MRLASAVLLAVLSIAAPVLAQAPAGPNPHLPPVDDKTGTNPLNLQQQVDVVNGYLELESLYFNTATYRHAVPLLGRRVRVAAGVPVVFGNLTGRTDGGLGDISADVEWTPWLSRRGGLVTGLRTTWNTASGDTLGYGAHTLTPYVQWVIQTSPRSFVAPLVGQRVSMGGDQYAPELNDTLVGLYAAWRVTPRVWIGAQPQVVFDLEYDRTFGDVSGEVGVMLLDRLSTYVRPVVGFGTDGNKPYTWGLAFGFRVVP